MLIITRRGSYTFLAILQGANTVLEFSNVASESSSFSCRVVFCVLCQKAAFTGGFNIESRGEGLVPSTKEDDGSDGRVVGQLVEDLAELQPHGLVEGIQGFGPVDADMSNIGLWARSGDEEVLEARVSSFGRHDDAGAGMEERYLELVTVPTAKDAEEAKYK